MFQQIEGGVTAAKGFSAASTAAGIKYKDRQDMAMVFSKVPCTVAGTFTTNVVKAAPVLWDKMIAEEKQTAQVVVINAGIANACTGEIGYHYCEETAKAAEEALKIPYESVFVASTGVIGKQLPIDKIKAGTKALAEKLSDTMEAGTDAAKAIMTTDTKKKEIAVSMTLGGKEVILGGMCKGSGMIHPNMCTMLGFITTDANISKELLDKALKEDVQDTYNMVSVDGDTSTNDTVLLMANGLAENEKVVSADSDDYKTFAAALHFVNEYLAKRIAEDGEGATKLFTAKVVNAKSKAAAKCLAKSVITSSLTKAAVYGNDANWGRILCALGYSGESFDPYKVDITITDGTDTLKLVENGMATDYSEEFATKILGGKEVTAVADMKDGEAEATAWGCDLTYDYVKINADYRS
ncbi:MAG: bifunctional glutamate N-acetyltransferase/amino-acid acetyltransferase ArgJ [Lachnospiraceae bacterium]|nr:bifunctional glutamate N-acetyltransferase/amino-acid acetyltransferase ArgJ [Lachnospiraceae bacterium]